MRIKNRRKLPVIAAASLILVLSSPIDPEPTHKNPNYSEDWESLSKVNPTPDWFIDAKFGIYTHWGPTSCAFVHLQGDERLAGWHGMLMYGKNGHIRWQTGELPLNKDGTPDTRPTANYLYHVKHFGDPAEFGYKELIKQFNPSGFDAKEWADIFASSGAKFAGPVAMHHDNFAMWDSKATRWNSMNYGGIDAAGELKREIEARGMKFMASFHHAFTWEFFVQAHDFGVEPEDYDLYTEPHGFRDKPSKEFCDAWWAKLKEFIDAYQPDLLWFDWWLENFDEAERLKFLAYYYNKGLEWGKDVAVCYKESTFTTKTAINDYERGRPNMIVRPPWLTDTSPGAWFYRPNAQFATADEIIDILVDIVSKNGCMLLNVPPDPDGTIPPEMKSLLAEMGAWLKINGEAIYDTRTWDVYGEGPTRLPSGGHKVEEKGKIIYTSKDIRFTKKSDTEFFAIVLDKPEGDIVVKSLSSHLTLVNTDIRKVELLGSDETIRWSINEEGLVIEAPASYPTEHAHAFRITLETYRETDIDGEI